MTQKERLIDLLIENETRDTPEGAENEMQERADFLRPWAEKCADYLLSNGVIVPPFRIGEDVYCISPFRLLADRIRKDQPFRIDFDEEKGFVFVTFTGVFYENEVFKTKEEAEAALKEMDEHD